MNVAQRSFFNMNVLSKESLNVFFNCHCASNWCGKRFINQCYISWNLSDLVYPLNSLFEIRYSTFWIPWKSGFVVWWCLKWGGKESSDWWWWVSEKSNSCVTKDGKGKEEEKHRNHVSLFRWLLFEISFLCKHLCQNTVHMAICQPRTHFSAKAKILASVRRKPDQLFYYKTIMSWFVSTVLSLFFVWIPVNLWEDADQPMKWSLVYMTTV
jgi:hypothetical protein